MVVWLKYNNPLDGNYANLQDLNQNLHVATNILEEFFFGLLINEVIGVVEGERGNGQALRINSFM